MGLCQVKRLKKENQNLNVELNKYKNKIREYDKKLKELEAENKLLNDHCDNLQSELWELAQQNIILPNNINNMNFYENQFCMAQCHNLYNNKKNDLQKINIIFKIN